MNSAWLQRLSELILIVVNSKITTELHLLLEKQVSIYLVHCIWAGRRTDFGKLLEQAWILFRRVKKRKERIVTVK